MSSSTDEAVHAGHLLTVPTSLSTADLVTLSTLIEGFEQGLVSPAEVQGLPIGEAIELIASRRSA
jgi:hypothetical protein